MTIKLNGNTDGSVSLQAPADTSPSGTDIELTLPTTAGSANQFVKNSGTAGTLEYSSMVEDSSGKLGIGTSSPSTALHISGTGVNDSRATFTRSGASGAIGVVSNDLFLAGTGTNDTNGGIQFYAGGVKRAEIVTDGRFVLGGITPSTSVDHSVCTSGRIESDATYSITTSSAANVHVSSTGLFSKSTSSRKYKTNIETMEDSYADAVLNARPVWFNSTAPEDTEHPEWGYWGFIAEEIHDIDPRLVFYGRENEEGNLEPEGVQYDRFVPHLINLVKRQKEQIEALTTRIAALEAES